MMGGLTVERIVQRAVGDASDAEVDHLGSVPAGYCLIADRDRPHGVPP
jgi:hypothetical protein